jgi:exodeoxyribonuclease V gamma subunit
LQRLLELYRDGLHRPLHFFPRSAWAYLREDANLAEAIRCWRRTSFRAYGEELDPAYRLALRGVEQPLDAEFIDCATQVFSPLLQSVLDARLK